MSVCPLPAARPFESKPIRLKACPAVEQLREFAFGNLAATFNDDLQAGDS